MRRTAILLLVSVLSGTASLSAFDRGLGDPKSVYIPRGTLAASLSGGYNSLSATGESDIKGVNLAGLVTDVNGAVTLYNVNAGLAWFVRDNLSIGARFGYGNTILDDNNLSLLGLINLTNKHIRRETYAAALAVRGYMPLFDSRVFALFFEGRLSGSLGYNKSYEVTDRGKEGSYSDLYPAALEGYACYKPKAIDIAQDPYAERKGQTDVAHVFVLLTDWEKPFTVSPPESLVDFDGDAAIIGYGKVLFDKEMEGYERFQVDIEYRSERTPKYLTIVTSSSALGDYFTGGTGSVLYLDEFAFLYKAAK